MTWSKEAIIQLLLSDNNALERAVIAIYNRQTESEKNCGETLHSNGQGFSGAHANTGSYYARWLLSGRHLSGNHISRAQRMMMHYHKQLAECMSTIVPSTNG